MQETTQNGRSDPEIRSRSLLTLTRVDANLIKYDLKAAYVVPLLYLKLA